MTLVVDGDASVDKLRELERMARERRPGVYCLTNPIPLETCVERA